MTTITNTPWGHAQNAQMIGAGVYSVETASHGGIFVTDEMLPAIPAAWRAYAKKWSQSENWFEEDCAWSAVAVTFPTMFSPDVVDRAHKISAHFLPKL